MGKLEKESTVIAVKLQGGLGNQMFQYAAAYALATKCRAELKLDLSFLEATAAVEPDGFTIRKFGLDIFPAIEKKFLSEKERQRFIRPGGRDSIRKAIGWSYPKIFIEHGFSFNDDFLLQKDPVYLDGYWQSEKYFAQNEAAIRRQFAFPLAAIDAENLQTLATIQNCNSVSVHVRRADYLHPKIAAYHGVCSPQYYHQAVAHLKNEINNAAFFVFTDDVGWATENLLPFMQNTMIVQDNSGADSWKDMFLMSKCKHHIIANSSFSWWGAWLGINPQKIIVVPKDWFATAERDTTDLLPDSWIKL